MKVMKNRFLRACLSKWRKMERQTTSSPACRYLCEWISWRFMYEEDCSNIPRDVPKGHLVVYVGDNYRRFVIKVTLLNHPLIKALLDQAKDEYDFNTADTKLFIPCDEKHFLSIIRCAGSAEEYRRISLCL